MSEPDFSPWSPQVSKDDLVAALAAAGILFAQSIGYPFSSQEDELAFELGKILADKENIIHWIEPTFLTKKIVQHTPAQSLANAWKKAAALYGSLGLEAEMENYQFLDWYLRKLLAAIPIQTFYVRIPPTSPYMDWLWPLRIGFLPDEQGRIFQKRFENWLEGNSWAQGIVQMIDAQTAGSTLDILIIPDAEAILSGLKSSRRAVRANCLLAFGRGEAGLNSFAGQFSRFANLTQAMGFVFVDIQPDGYDPGPNVFEQWMAAFLYHLSHNEPFNRVVQSVSDEVMKDPAKAVFFGSQFFIQAALPSARVDMLVDELKQIPNQKIEVQGRMCDYLHLSPGSYNAYQISKQLQQFKNSFGFYGETHEATTVSTLTSVARQANPLPSENRGPRVERGAVHLAPEPKRFLQTVIEDEHLHEPVDLLIAEKPYHMSVFIGSLVKDWHALGMAFPEDQLPKSGGSHLLTVVLTEPVHLSEPLVGTLDLPPKGASNICNFHFTVSEKSDSFEARLLVLYENRVLQTGLLRSPVWRPPGKRPDGKLEFVPEGSVRPLTLDLSQRTSYDTAFVFNHASNGEASVTRVTGCDAVVIDLAGVEEIIKNIMRLFNASDWEKKKAFDRLEAEDTRTLLCNLAVHGFDLHRVLVKDLQASEALLKSEYIQAIMAKENYHFPVEFCYQRLAPKSTAKICPHARPVLEKLDMSALGSACLDNCETKDQPRDYICPLAFWGLNRVIEWHQFQPEDRKKMEGGDYMLTNEPTQNKGKLQPLKGILFGVSDKIDDKDVSQFQQFVHDDLKLQPVKVDTWQEWEDKIKDKPTTLLLMIHSEMVQEKPSMEIHGELLDPPNIDESRVGDASQHPLVLLLGCGTRYADVPTQSLSAGFRREGAAIVVSTIAELLNTHAPRLAKAILAELGKTAGGERSFGEVMLAVKRQGLLNDLPIALALVAYGDADWKV